MTPGKAPGYDRYDAKGERLICWNCCSVHREVSAEGEFQRIGGEGELCAIYFSNLLEKV